MNFKSHLDLEGKHAFLSPSSYHWLNYTEQKLDARFISVTAARRGTALHDFARDAINLGIKLPKTKKTLNMYVNDAIDLKMTTEQPLYYSPNCFGHADTISFHQMLLRVHDLKNGVTKSSMSQLEVYAGLFCLEYGMSPYDIAMQLRIYQNNEVLIHIPEPSRILDIMDKIIQFDIRIERLKEEGGI